MLISGTPNSIQPHYVQAQYLQASFTYSQTRSSQTGGQQTDNFSSAITLSLSITAITVTSGFLATEDVIEEAAPDDDNPPLNHSRAKGIAKALQNLMSELEENEGLTGKVAKRLFKLVSALNSARGTDIKLGDMDKDDREEVRSARQQVNDFFRGKKSTVLFDEDLANFISLVSKLETLREFILKTTDLLEALNKEEPDDADIPDATTEQPPIIDIEA